jgi:23S rRNA pseudouridine1911/1915/1917 synthase
MTSPQETIFILPEEEGNRLDKILASRYTNVRSRTYFEKLIKENKVLLNGEPVKKRVLVKSGDEVEIFFLLTPDVTLKPEPIPLAILYEDEDVIAINKPVGLVVHPAPGNWTATFVNALLYHCGMPTPSGALRPGIVHRLDKDTTGVLIAAKSELAQTRLIEMFAKRQIKKTYFAICIGNPGEGVISAPIGRHPKDRKKMAVREDGREAITYYKTVAFDGKLSFVEIDLKTGRTHQIRVHMKHLGTPIFGDQVYGRGEGRQLLHAAKLALLHPITQKPLEIVAPLPEDMKRFKLVAMH